MRKLIIGIGFIMMGISVQGQEITKLKITELAALIHESKTPVVINFWATWCKPCIEEIPYFIEEIKDRQKDSVRLILVSLDTDGLYRGGLSGFVKKRKFDRADVYWLDETNADYFCPLVDPNWSGAIPATLFINNRSGYRKFFEEEMGEKEFKVEVENLVRGEK